MFEVRSFFNSFALFNLLQIFIDSFSFHFFLTLVVFTAEVNKNYSFDTILISLLVFLRTTLIL